MPDTPTYAEPFLIRDEIRALSDDDLDKEIAFADSFQHAKDGSPERSWRLELHAEKAGRQYAALLAFGSELYQAAATGMGLTIDEAVESDLARQGGELVTRFRTQALLGLL